MHTRSKHPNEYHLKALEDLEGKVDKKKRWTQEEISSMAQKEAEIIYALGNIDNMNQELRKVVPGRTIEAIKGKRRPATYKKMVQDILGGLASGAAGDPEPQHSSSSSSSNEDLLAQPDRNISPAADSSNYNMEITTEMYVSPETYIHDLNTDRRFRGVLEEAETNLLDQAFLNIHDNEKCKNLLTAFVNTLIKTIEPRKKKGKFIKPKKNISKRKQKRILYTKFQRLYNRNRKKAFDSLYNNNSISPELNEDTVFEYWKHLLTHVSLTEPNPANLEQDRTPIEFSTDLLIYPEEVAACNPKGKSAAGLDGLSVYDTLRIPNRTKAKMFSLFLILHWMPDVLLNSFTIFIPKKACTIEPSNLRTISIASNLTRQFHKLLTSRINSLVTFSKYQFGFQKLDGVARGIDLLQAILRSVQ